MMRLTEEEIIAKYCHIEKDISGSESHRVETALSNVVDAMNYFRMQECEELKDVLIDVRSRVIKNRTVYNIITKALRH